MILSYEHTAQHSTLTLYQSIWRGLMRIYRRSYLYIQCRCHACAFLRMYMHACACVTRVCVCVYMYVYLFVCESNERGCVVCDSSEMDPFVTCFLCVLSAILCFSVYFSSRSFFHCLSLSLALALAPPVVAGVVVVAVFVVVIFLYSVPFHSIPFAPIDST